MFMAGALLSKMGLDISGWTKSISRVGSDMSGLKAKFDEISVHATRMAVRMAAGGAAITAFLGKALSESMSDAQAVRSATIIMGDASKDAIDWCRQLASAVGEMDDTIINTMTDMDLMVEGMGINAKSAQDLSRTLTKLVYQYAIVRGGMMGEDVAAAIQSALRGNARALSSYGITIKEEMILQEGLNLGLIRVGETMTENDKIAARASVIIRESERVTRGYAASVDSLGNVWKRYKTALLDALEPIGRNVEPLFLKVLALATNMTHAFKAWYVQNREVASSITFVAACLGGLLTVGGTSIFLTKQLVGILSFGVSTLALFASGAWSVVRALAGLGSSLAALRLSFLGFAAPLYAIIGLVALIGTSVYVLYKEIRHNVGGIGDIWKGLVEVIRKCWNTALDYTTEFVNKLKTLFPEVFARMKSGFQNVVQGLAQGFSGVYGLLSGDEWDKIKARMDEVDVWGDKARAKALDTRLREITQTTAKLRLLGVSEEAIFQTREKLRKQAEAEIYATKFPSQILPKEISGFLVEVPGTLSDWAKMMREEIGKDLDSTFGWIEKTFGRRMEHFLNIVTSYTGKGSVWTTAIKSLWTMLSSAATNAIPKLGKMPEVPRFDAEAARKLSEYALACAEATDHIRQLKNEVAGLIAAGTYQKAYWEAMTSAQREYEEGLTKIVGGTEAQKKEQIDLLLVIKNLKVAQAAYNAEATKTSATVSAYQGMSPWEQAKAWKEYSVVRTKQIDDEITKMREEGVAEDILTATRIDNIRKLTESHPIFPTKSFVTSLAEGVTNAWASLGSSMSSAFSTAFEGVLNKTKTWSQAMKGLFTDLKSSMIGMLADLAAKMIAEQMLTAVKFVGIQLWKAAAAVYSWMAATFGPWAIPLAAAALAGIVSAVAALKPHLLEGTDYVPKTGAYMLHEGEKVTPRPFVGKSSDDRKINVTLVNLVTTEAVASAMSARAGRNVIINTITADVAANGMMRQVILGG